MAGLDLMFDRWVRYTLIAAIFSSVFSVAVYSIFLGVSILLWAIQALRQRRILLKAPEFFPAVLVFCLACLLATIFSVDPGGSLPQLARLLRFLPVVWIFTYFRKSDVWLTIMLVLGGLALSALYGLLQYIWLLDVGLMNRIRGFMSHWMTFSGQVMIAWVVCFALVVFSRRKSKQLHLPKKLGAIVRWVLPAISMALYALALLLTFTRSAWIGALLGTAFLVLLWNWRMFFPGILVVVLGFALLPPHFKARFYSGLDLTDTTSQGRLELAATGWNMIKDHPLTGVGPGMVPKQAPRYAVRFEENENFPAWLYQHLHNSPLQVAAETGLIGLAAWLALWGVLFRQLWKFQSREASDPQVFLASVGALGVLVAFLTSGLLEYNFGDSEILTLVLFLVTAPYACREARPAEA